jgi:hypothetical protein
MRKAKTTHVCVGWYPVWPMYLFSWQLRAWFTCIVPCAWSHPLPSILVAAAETHM